LLARAAAWTWSCCNAAVILRSSTGTRSTSATNG
jgi:hypothetical protein